MDFKISPPWDSNEGYISKCVPRGSCIFCIIWHFRPDSRVFSRRIFLNLFHAVKPSWLQRYSNCVFKKCASHSCCTADDCRVSRCFWVMYHFNVGIILFLFYISSQCTAVWTLVSVTPTLSWPSSPAGHCYSSLVCHRTGLVGGTPPMWRCDTFSITMTNCDFLCEIWFHRIFLWDILCLNPEHLLGKSGRKTVTNENKCSSKKGAM